MYGTLYILKRNIFSRDFTIFSQGALTHPRIKCPFPGIFHAIKSNGITLDQAIEFNTKRSRKCFSLLISEFSTLLAFWYKFGICMYYILGTDFYKYYRRPCPWYSGRNVQDSRNWCFLSVALWSLQNIRCRFAFFCFFSVKWHADTVFGLLPCSCGISIFTMFFVGHFLRTFTVMSCIDLR